MFRAIAATETNLFHQWVPYWCWQRVSTRRMLRVVSRWQEEPLWFLSTPPESVIDLSYMAKYPVKPNCRSLGCRAYFSNPGPHSKRGSRFQSRLERIDLWDSGLNEFRTVSGFNRTGPLNAEAKIALQVFVCSASTVLTINHHLVLSHLLSTGTLWCLIQRHLPRRHWLYQLLHPHLFAVSEVNSHKGIGLMNSFVHDFSLTEDGLRQFLKDTVESTNLLEIINQFTKQDTTSDSSGASSGMAGRTHRAWRLCQKYAGGVAAAAKKEEKEGEKKELDVYTEAMFAELKSLPWFDGIRDVETLISTALFYSVYFHEMVGDKIENLANVMQPWIAEGSPDDSKVLAHQQVAKSVAMLIFWEATRFEHQLSALDWIESLPRWMQPFAKHFQTGMLGIDRGFELGVNK